MPKYPCHEGERDNPIWVVLLFICIVGMFFVVPAIKIWMMP